MNRIHWFTLTKRYSIYFFRLLFASLSLWQEKSEEDGTVINGSGGGGIVSTILALITEFTDYRNQGHDKNIIHLNYITL